VRRYVPIALALAFVVLVTTQACAMPHWMEEALKRIGDAYNDVLWGRW
jgi:hypothetical protein